MACNMAANPTAYIDEIFKFDEKQRKNFNNVRDGSMDFTSGSVAEGAFICRGVQDIKLNFEMDTMRPIGEISLEKSSLIMTSTDQVGYYRLRFNEELLSCLNEKFSELLRMNDFEKDYLDGTLMKLYNKMIESDSAHRNYYETEYADGSPSVYGKTNMGVLQIETDTVLCIKLLFWPDIIKPWFERERHWPSPEVVHQIYLGKCHLVVKKSNEDGGSKNQWRISLSLAENLLSKNKNIFQKKCYLLAKFMYYESVKQHIDEETGRHISSYILKTTMLYMLEETNQEEWSKLENGNCYVEVVCRLFKKMADNLEKGHLSFFFVTEMNLFASYSQVFLKKMVEKIRSICDEWKGTEGEKLFHAKINGMFNFIKSKPENMPEKKKMDCLQISYEDNKTQYLLSENSNPAALDKIATMEKMNATMARDDLNDKQKSAAVEKLQREGNLSFSDMQKMSIGGNFNGKLQTEVDQGYLTQKEADQSRIKVNEAISQNLSSSISQMGFFNQPQSSTNSNVQIGPQNMLNSMVGNKFVNQAHELFSSNLAAGFTITDEFYNQLQMEQRYVKDEEENCCCEYLSCTII